MNQTSDHICDLEEEADRLAMNGSPSALRLLRALTAYIARLKRQATAPNPAATVPAGEPRLTSARLGAVKPERAVAN